MMDMLTQFRVLKRILNFEKKRSGRNRLSLLKMFVYQYYRHGVGPAEFITVGYAFLDKKDRDDYLSIREMVRLSHALNKQGIDDKWRAYQKLKPYYGRDMVHLKCSTPEEVTRFLQKHPSFFAKATDAFGGKGVERITLHSEQDKAAILDRLMAKRQYLLEEAIRPHALLQSLSPHAVSTLRFVSFLGHNGEVRFLPVIMRCSLGERHVDNLCAGGAYVLVGPDGKIAFPCFIQQYVLTDCTASLDDFLLERHPLTDLQPMGLEIPYFHEARAMVEKLARQCPEAPVLGWDIAIAEKGPVVVEINSSPGCEISCDHYFKAIYKQKSMGFRRMLEAFWDREIPAYR